MIYIQRKDHQLNTLETEALTMVKEYRLSDYSAEYYLSQRACGGWNE